MHTVPTLWRPDRPFERALVLIAHPDDAEFGAAGTIARWVEMGTEVHYVVVTDGAGGSVDPQMTRERLVPLREEEQRAACASLGVADVAFLRHRDGHLEPSLALRRDIAALVRRHRPHALLTLNPDVRWSSRGLVNHPDHRVVGDLALHAVNPAASSRLWDETLLDEGLEPWEPSEVWLMSFGDGNDIVDVTETFDKKMKALRCHQTQVGHWDPDPLLRELAEAAGRSVGVGLAEAFTVLRMREKE